MKYRTLGFFVLIILFSLPAYSQIFTRFKSSDTLVKPVDSILVSKAFPDADRDEIPFIDYLPVTIWTGNLDTIHNFGYIRKNFTDQLLSVWNPPGRIYPASRIYAISLGGNYYRTVNVSPQNYVFAQQMVKGELNLYMYRKIPQTNGWVEMRSEDANNPGYTNYMIVEVQGMRGVRNLFGYFISLKGDSNKLIPVSINNIKTFAANYFSDTPLAMAEAMKFEKTTKMKSYKVLVAGLMTVGMVGALSSGPKGLWFFAAGFPLVLVTAFFDRPKTMHWDDMARIVDLHNRELTGKKNPLPD